MSELAGELGFTKEARPSHPIIRVLKSFHVDSGTLLDFGCGDGRYLDTYAQAGFDAHGCDVVARSTDARVRLIETPYRLPYPDGMFDVIASTGVLEHALNTVEVFREIRRVLKPGGIAVHLFPTRFYLPREPHIYVPLANFFRPVPRWYLSLWAALGIRNEYQRGMTAREVVADNERFCMEGLNYLTCGEIERLSLEVFGNFAWQNLGRPGFLRHIRMAVVVHRG